MSSSEGFESGGIAGRIALALVVLCLTAVVAEVGYRLYLTRNGHTFFDDPAAFISPFFTIFDEPSPLFSNDNAIFLNAAVPTVKPDGEMRVVCLGGSTTVNQRTYASFSALLDRRFAAEKPSGAPTVRVLNAGGDGFSSAHTLVNFQLRVLAVNPDVVVVMHNINDLSANYFGEHIEPDYANKYLTDYYLDLRHREGPIAALSRVSRLARRVVMTISALRYPQARTYDDRSYETGIEYFRRNLRNIVAAGRANGVRVVLMSQPGGETLRKSEGFTAYNRVVAEVARSEDVVFVDLAASVQAPEFFREDELHYTDKGVDAVAARVYAALGFLR